MVCRLPAAKHHSHGRDDRTASPEPAEPPAADAPTPDPDPGGSDAPTPGPDVGARRAPYPGRPLRRSRDNRVVAGVCGALARYTDVDPVVYRVTLAVLSIFGGVGLLLYVIGWLLIPAEGAAGSVLDRAVHRRTGSRPSVPALVGIGLAVVILAGIVSNNGSAVLALVLIGAVALLAHRAQRPLVASPSDGDWDLSNQTAAVGTSPAAGSSERYAAGGAYAPYGGSASAPYGGLPVASPSPDWPGGTAMESRPRPPRSVLGLVTVSVCLLVVGALLVVANLTALQVTAAAVLASALVVVGLGLLVGARFGRSRGLMLLGVPLAAATLAASAVSTPVAAGLGDRLWQPVSTTELQPTYRLGAGDGTLDLSRLSGADARPVTASVGLGRLRVIVPRDLDVTVHGRAGAGNVTLFGDDHAGRRVDRQVTDPSVASTGSITLDLRVGVGHVEVDRASA